jgi:hypothetical protein
MYILGIWTDHRVPGAERLKECWLYRPNRSRVACAFTRFIVFGRRDDLATLIHQSLLHTPTSNTQNFTSWITASLNSPSLTSQDPTALTPSPQCRPNARITTMWLQTAPRRKRRRPKKKAVPATKVSPPRTRSIHGKTARRPSRC